MSGLFRDLIIHSGETLAEILEDREMTQFETNVLAFLYVRAFVLVNLTGMSVVFCINLLR